MKIYIARIDNKNKKIRIIATEAEDRNGELFFRDGALLHSVNKKIVGTPTPYEGYGFTKIEAIAALQDELDSRIKRLQEEINQEETRKNFPIETTKE